MVTSERADRQALVAPGAIELFARDMTVTVAADVTLGALQGRLAEVGQWVPVDGDLQAGVGTLVETDSSGPLRLGYGAWRDLLLGCQFNNGLGELVTAGGRAMKNVAGYDLTKFMVGQRGVFGRVVTITTRTYRRPAGAVIAEFAPEAGALGTLLTTTARPQWAVLRPESLYCGYLGDARTLAFVESILSKHGPKRVSERLTLDAEIERRTALFGPTEASALSQQFRAVVPPMQIAAFAKDAGVSDWSADAAFGAVRGTLAGTSIDAVRRAAKNVGGSAWEDGDDGPVIQAGASERAILERLKRAFDPDGRLAPLRFAEEIS